MKLPISVPAENIKPLSINGLSGRMVYIPNNKSKKIIIYIHGLHTLAERHYSLCEFFSDYGTVYAPDMPGFGGMDSFFKIGLKPNYDNFADYIYSFIKSLSLQDSKQLCFVGMSFGSQVMIRLLQKYPELTKNKPLLITMAGIGSRKDLNDLKLFKLGVYPLIFASITKPGAWIVDHTIYSPVIFRIILAPLILTKAKHKADSNRKKDIYAMEYNLWTREDRRTHASCSLLVLTGDLTKYSDSKIPLRVSNVYVEQDQYLNHVQVKKTMSKLFKEYHAIDVPINNHAPSLAATKKEVSDLFPEEVRQLLSA